MRYFAQTENIVC